MATTAGERDLSREPVVVAVDGSEHDRGACSGRRRRLRTRTARSACSPESVGAVHSWDADLVSDLVSDLVAG